MDKIVLTLSDDVENRPREDLRETAVYCILSEGLGGYVEKTKKKLNR